MGVLINTSTIERIETACDPVSDKCLITIHQKELKTTLVINNKEGVKIIYDQIKVALEESDFLEIKKTENIIDIILN